MSETQDQKDHPQVLIVRRSGPTQEGHLFTRLSTPSHSICYLTRVRQGNFASSRRT